MFGIFQKKTLTFNQSPHFKGFRRVWLSYYGHEPSELGVRAARTQPITQIKIHLFKDSFAVFCQNNQIGTFWVRDEKDRVFLDALKNGRVEAVHVRIEEEMVVGKNNLGDGITQTRPRPYLFLKIVEASR